MPISTSVKYLHSTLAGAPVLSGAAGALIAILDACLVDGWGVGTVDSVVVSGGIATVTRAGGHSFEVGSVALLAGATPAGLNGEKRVLTTSATTYTFDATGISNQTATGTITHKLAPAGFDKVYSGTNLAVYRSPNVAGTRMYLRVDDTGTVNGRVVGYESMTDVTTGLQPFPTAAQQSGGLFWPKSATANATARAWSLAADDRGFYLTTSHGSGTSNTTMGFGDFTSVKSPDIYACAIQGGPTDASGATSAGTAQMTSSIQAANPSNTGLYVCRAAPGLGGSAPATRASFIPIGDTSNPQHSGASSSFVSYPNATDAGLYLGDMHVVEYLGARAVRGRFPGLYFCPMQLGSSAFSLNDRVADLAALPDRTLRAIPNSTGCAFIDATGPWR